jgi:C-terminal processing protease CtpA/Prc
LATPTAAATSTIVVPVPTPTQTIAAAPTIAGYPFPVIRDNGSNTTSGYFLNGTGYEDVAVLAVTSFSPGGDIGFVAYMTDFQRVVQEFLALCKTNGKKKLVIDLAANGGGYIVAGYELFNQVGAAVDRDKSSGQG